MTEQILLQFVAEYQISEDDQAAYLARYIKLHCSGDAFADHLRRWTAEQGPRRGWDESTQIACYCDFIDLEDDPDCFEEFLGETLGA